jgi:hypothetical protein
MQSIARGCAVDGRLLFTELIIGLTFLLEQKSKQKIQGFLKFS